MPGYSSQDRIEGADLLKGMFEECRNGMPTQIVVERDGVKILVVMAKGRDEIEVLWRVVKKIRDKNRSKV